MQRSESEQHHQIDDYEQQQRAGDERSHDRYAEVVHQLRAHFVLLRDLDPDVARTQHEDVTKNAVDHAPAETGHVRPERFSRCLHGMREQGPIVAPYLKCDLGFVRMPVLASLLALAQIQLGRQRDLDRSRERRVLQLLGDECFEHTCRGGESRGEKLLGLVAHDTVAPPSRRAEDQNQRDQVSCEQSVSNGAGGHRRASGGRSGSRCRVRSLRPRHRVCGAGDARAHRWCCSPDRRPSRKSTARAECG